MNHLFTVRTSEPEADPCDTTECEEWELCERGTCYCDKPINCPQPAPGALVLCGTDNKEYASECHLKAEACYFRKYDLDFKHTGECEDGKLGFVVFKS